MGKNVMIMAGGTGGHVYPALAVAEELRARGHDIFWLGAVGGFEEKVVAEHGYPMELISIRGLRGKGLLRWLLAPVTLTLAALQAAGVLRRRRPGLVLGMGGFVSGPGGVMARLMGVPLVIQEQNAIPGMTNQLLARIASRVLEAFPGSFHPDRRARVTGNPVRCGITAVAAPEVRMRRRRDTWHLLILGGSQGARAINETVPAALAKMEPSARPRVLHQAGGAKLEATQAAYANAGVEADIRPYITDMGEALTWADLVICRAGAMTIAELAAAGVASILIPYPHAVDDHQTHNGAFLADRGAALLLPESGLSPQRLASELKRLGAHFEALLAMAQAARTLGLPQATNAVADICQEVISS